MNHRLPLQLVLENYDNTYLNVQGHMSHATTDHQQQLILRMSISCDPKFVVHENSNRLQI